MRLQRLLCITSIVGGLPASVYCQEAKPLPRHKDRQPSVDATCTFDAWTPPHTLATSAGQPVAVDAPFAVATANGIVLFGTPTFVWHSEKVFVDTALAAVMQLVDPDATAGAMITADGTARPIPAPTGFREMISPSAVAGLDGVLHVVWAMSSDTSAGPRVFGSALWYA